MFDRVRIKEMAKTALKRRYWIAVLVAVIIGLLGGSLAGGMTDGGLDLNLNVNLPESNIDVNNDIPMDNPWVDNNDAVWDQYENGDPTYDENYTLSDIWADFVTEWNAIMDEFSADLGVDLQSALAIFFGVLILIAVIALVFASLFTILVSNVMTVGGHGWMLRHWRGEEVSVGETFAGFRIYKPSVLTMLVRGIYIWLWSLLFIIPGIVKGYAYSMTPYIIYENPNLTANEAIKMSKKMTDGYKGDLFVLSLSFIGWKFLSGVTGGLVGIFWANPYMGLTHAGVYEDLKWKAIQSGKLTWEDFGQLPPPPADPFENTWSNPTNPYGGGWSAPAPQQPWGNPAPQQPAWDNPAPTPQQPNTWNDPSHMRW